MQKTFDPCYKQDTKGKTRIWFMEQNGGCYRTHAGIMDGAIVVSDWTQAEPTNVGRSNERDSVAQATFEIEASYEKKLTREYHRTLEAISGGAHFFKPMLAQKYEGWDDSISFAQPKLDGVRCIARADGMFSREGKPLPGAAFIHEQLKGYFDEDPDLILDGELYNHELREDFNEVIRLVKKASGDAAHVERVRMVVQYHVYDMPSAKAPFGARNNWLCEMFINGGLPDNVVLVETQQVESAAEFDELHGRWLEEGFEGSMWRADKPYEQKRSKTLQKRKEFQDEEFKVVRIEEGLGNWSGVAKRVVCQLPDGREFGAGIKGSKERAKVLLHESHNVVTIKFFAYTPDGVPRFPVATKFHGEARTL